MGFSERKEKFICNGDIEFLDSYVYKRLDFFIRFLAYRFDKSADNSAVLLYALEMVKSLGDVRPALRRYRKLRALEKQSVVPRFLEL